LREVHKEREKLANIYVRKPKEKNTASLRGRGRSSTVTGAAMFNA